MSIKRLLSLFLIGQLCACTLLGAVAGKQLDDHRNTPLYQEPLMQAGAAVDEEIIKGLLSNRTKKPEIWEETPTPCPNEIRVCSAKSGDCWCESLKK
jgi:hypothetical protein